MAATYLYAGCHVFIWWLLLIDLRHFTVIAAFTVDLHLVTFNPHKYGHCHLSPLQYTSVEPGMDTVLCLIYVTFCGFSEPKFKVLK